MPTKLLKMNRISDFRRQTSEIRFLFSVLCFLLCVSLVGCKPDSNTMVVNPSQGDIAGLIEGLHSPPRRAEPIEQRNPVNTDLAGKKEKTALAAFTGPETAENSYNDLTYSSNPTTAPQRNISPPEKTQVYCRGEVPTANDSTIITPDTSSSELRPWGIIMPMLDKPGMADELISVNFDQVDIRTVLKTIGDITGINFVVDNSVRGTVTVMSPTKIRLGDVFKVLESILEVQGYAAVPAGDRNFVKIVPKAAAVKHNLQVRVGSNPSQIPKDDSLVTQIIPLTYADATEVGQIVQPLLATDAQMTTYPRTNSIVIIDTSSNIHHIAKVIQELDVRGSKEDVTVFGLKYASAQVLSEQITHIMQKSRTGLLPASGRGRQVSGIEATMKVLPDLRTNSLIAIANEQDTRTIAQLVEQLDIERPREATNVHVVYLKNAQAREAADSLTGALANLRIAGALEATQDVQVTADEGTNALIIAASAQDFEVVAEIIEKLDIVREQVLVEMLIMEVSEDALKEIGIDWASLDQAVEGSVRFFGATNFGPRVDFASGDLEGLAVGAWRGSGTNVRIGTMLHALEKQSGVNILSTPHILTSNHHKAKIIVGENRPFVMESRITETTDFITPTVIKTYQYKDVGITLEITPHISQGGLVRLEIDSEFTKLIEDVTTSSTDTPTTAKRQAQTVVSMGSGSTVIIGGLIRDDKVTIDKKVPLVADIPLIGNLFKFRRDRLQKTNLLIFITPYVLGSQDDLTRITNQKQEQMKSALGGEELGENNAEH